MILPPGRQSPNSFVNNAGSRSLASTLVTPAASVPCMNVVAFAEGIKLENIASEDRMTEVHLPEDGGNRAILAEAPWSCVCLIMLESQLRGR